MHARQLGWLYLIATCIAGAPSPAQAAASSAAYSIATIADGLVHPWSLAFLPDGRLLVTERAGRLRVIDRDAGGGYTLRAEPVTGLPTVYASGQAGLFDVMLDPGFAESGLIYLSFAHGEHKANHLRVVRADSMAGGCTKSAKFSVRARRRATASTSAGAWPCWATARW